MDKNGLSCIWKQCVKLMEFTSDMTVFGDVQYRLSIIYINLSNDI